MTRNVKTLEIEDHQHGTLMYLDVGDAEMHAMTQQQRKYQQNRDRGPPQEHKDARSYYRRGYQQNMIDYVHGFEKQVKNILLQLQTRASRR